jgi:hypothetical protein
MSGSASPGISRRNPQDEYELVQRIGKNLLDCAIKVSHAHKHHSVFPIR